MQLRELLTAVVLVFVTTWLAVLVCHGLQAGERRYALLSFALHVPSSFGQWALQEYYYERVADVYEYARVGDRIAELLKIDFLRYAPEVLKLAVHMDARVPVEIIGEGMGTGTMCAIAGVFASVLGRSVLLMCVLSGWISWFGQVACYRVAREEVEPADQRAALLAFFFVPSVIIWGAAFTKESLAFGAFGVLFHNTYLVLRRRRWTRLVWMVLGGATVAFIKPYVLVPYVMAVAAFTYADLAWRRRSSVMVRPAYLVLVAGVAFGGVVGLGAAFPQFSAEKVTETVAHQRESWQNIAGESNIEDAGEARTVSQQIRMVPLALVTALFRPTVFEVKNGPALAAAAETSLLTLGVISLLGARRRRLTWSAFIGSPILVFCSVFVVIFGAAVGLATQNFGSLSRYRAPMMPFYVLLLLVARRRMTSSTPLEPDEDQWAREEPSDVPSPIGAEPATSPAGPRDGGT